MSSGELAGVADRAGYVVRDQIASMAEAAQGRASEIERNARDAAEAARREAIRSATEVMEDIGAVERELASLLRSLSQEADDLRAKLDRARLLSRFGDQSPAMLAIEGKAIAIEGTLPAPPDEDPAHLFSAVAPQSPAEHASPAGDETPADDQARDVPVEDEREAQAPAAAESHPEPEESEASATHDPEEGRPAETDAGDASKRAEEAQALPASGGHEGAGILDEEAQWRVTASTDLQLAEIYRTATMRLADSTESTDPPRRYWAALEDAAVEEAARRANFGRPDESKDLSRRAKKERAKALKPLAKAREEALARRQWAEAPNPRGRDTVS